MLKLASENAEYRWVILGTVSSVQFILSMTLFSFGPLAPFLLEDLHISRAQVGLFSSLMTLASMVLSMPAGWLIDRYGVRWLLLIGSGTFGLLFALFSQVPSLGIGYFVIFMAGIGYTFAAPTVTMALVRWFPLNTRATALSVKQSAVTIGSAVGAMIIPTLAIWLGWRNTVAILGGAVVVIVIVGFRLLREGPQASRAPQTDVLATFRRLLKNRNLIHLGLTCACYGALQVGIANYLVLQLVEVRNMSAVEAGTYLMSVNIGGAVGRIIWGSVSDRAFGGRRKPVLTIIGIISGILAIVLSKSVTSLPTGLLFFLLVLCGATSFGWNGVFMAFATEISGKETAATGLGMALTIGTLGLIAGPPVFGYIVDRFSSYGLAWLIFGILALLAALSLILIRESKSSQ
jgi:MFS transporter, ACS family, hexuronate transporter